MNGPRLFVVETFDCGAVRAGGLVCHLNERHRGKHLAKVFNWNVGAWRFHTWARREASKGTLWHRALADAGLVGGVAA